MHSSNSAFNIVVITYWGEGVIGRKQYDLRLYLVNVAVKYNEAIFCLWPRVKLLGFWPQRELAKGQWWYQPWKWW